MLLMVLKVMCRNIYSGSSRNSVGCCGLVMNSNVFSVSEISMVSMVIVLVVMLVLVRVCIIGCKSV